MTLSQLKQKIDYAIAANGDCDVHVQIISDQCEELNYLDDGRVNDVEVSRPFGEDLVLISIDLP